MLHLVGYISEYEINIIIGYGIWGMLVCLHSL